jgi:hypothetical protein
MRDIAALLTRPVGRPAYKPVVWYKGFLYRAASWTTARRVVAKVEFHAGELFPRVGFIVTNTLLRNRKVRFGTRLEQRFSREEIRTMMMQAGLERINFSASTSTAYPGNQDRYLEWSVSGRIAVSSAEALHCGLSLHVGIGSNWMS